MVGPGSTGGDLVTSDPDVTYTGPGGIGKHMTVFLNLTIPCDGVEIFAMEFQMKGLLIYQHLWGC